MTHTGTHTSTFPKADFAILGVTADVDDGGLKAARNRLVKKNHPDLCGGDPDAAQRLVQINAAYERILAWRRSPQSKLYEHEKRREQSSGAAGERTRAGAPATSPAQPRSGQSSRQSSEKSFADFWPKFDENHPFYSWAKDDPATAETARRAEEEARERKRAEELRRREERREREEAARRQAEEEERRRQEEAERNARIHAATTHSLIIDVGSRRLLEESKRHHERQRAYSAATRANGGIYQDPRLFSESTFGGFFSTGHIPDSIMVCGRNILAYLPEGPACRETDFLLLPELDFLPGQIKLLPNVLSLTFAGVANVGGWKQFTCDPVTHPPSMAGFNIQACQRQV